MRGRACIAAVALFVACGGGKATPPRIGPARATKVHAVRAPGHPTVVSLERGGDPRSGLALVVATDGADAPGSVAVALAALLDAKLDAKYGARVAALPASVRVDALFDSPEAAASLIEAVRAVLVAPIDDASWTTAQDRAPHYEGPEARVAACTGGSGKERSLSRDELDEARRKIVGADAVSIGVVGRVAIGTGASWPKGARGACGRTDDGRVAYELHGVGVARADVLAWRSPEEAIETAANVGPLVAKLRAADPGARVTQVSAVAQPRGGCVDVRIELPSADPSSIARLSAIAQNEIDRQQTPSDALPTDPRDAANVLATLELSRVCPPASGSSTVVAVPAGADKLEPQLRSELQTATAAWAAPVAATTRLVEVGQPDALVLVGSPCGNRAEDPSTAGATLEVLGALSKQATSAYGIDAEPVVSFDAAGILARARSLPGESSVALGKRLGEAAGRAFGTDPLNETAPLRGASPDDAFALLASSLITDHPMWVDPRFVARTSRSVQEARLEAIRRAPVRVVVVSNDGPEQADALAAGVDRFLLRHGSPSCSPDAHVDPPRPGTYVKPGASEAYLALPISADPSCSSAPFIVVALRELLSRAVVGVARSSDARIVSTPVGRFLVAHVDAPSASLDAVVSQTRALFDRLRQGALADADLARAVATEDADQKSGALDPRIRILRAWRGEQPPPPPTKEAVRSCAEKTFRDEALVIAATRSTMAP